MAGVLGLVLGAALLFSFPGPSSLPSAGAGPAYAQTTRAAPGNPAKTKISFKGGPGDTPATAVVISGASDSLAGIAAEYSYLARKFGRQNVDWTLQRQSVLQQEDKVFDQMEIELKDTRKKTIFFDITEFFGKL
jgi:hypothetical protein